MFSVIIKFLSVFILSVACVFTHLLFQVSKVLKLRSVVLQCIRDHYLSRGYFEVLVYRLHIFPNNLIYGVQQSERCHEAVTCFIFCTFQVNIIAKHNMYACNNVAVNY